MVDITVLRELRRRFRKRYPPSADPEVEKHRQRFYRTAILAMFLSFYTVVVTSRLVLQYRDNVLTDDAVKTIEHRLVQQQLNIDQLFRINSDIQDRNIELKLENQRLSHSVSSLILKNKKLNEENKEYRDGIKIDKCRREDIIN